MAYVPDDRRYMTFEQRAQDDPRYVVKFDRKLAESERFRYYAAESEARMLARRARAAGDLEEMERHAADMRYWETRRREVDEKLRKHAERS